MKFHVLILITTLTFSLCNSVLISFRFRRWWNEKIKEGYYGAREAKQETYHSCSISNETPDFFGEATDCLLKEKLIKEDDEFEFVNIPESEMKKERNKRIEINPIYNFILANNIASNLVMKPSKLKNYPIDQALELDEHRWKLISINHSEPIKATHIIKDQCNLQNLRDWFPDKKGDGVSIRKFSEIKFSAIAKPIYNIYFSLPSHLTLEFKQKPKKSFSKLAIISIFIVLLLVIIVCIGIISKIFRDIKKKKENGQKENELDDNNNNNNIMV